MEFIETKLEGVYIIEQNVFQDSRGDFVKTFQASEFKKRNLEFNFKEYDPFFNINTTEDLEFAEKLSLKINE